MRAFSLLLATMVLSLPLFLQSQNSTEIVSKRTEFSKTFKNQDGTYTNDISLVPIHYKKGDEWKPIDTRIIQDLNGFSNKTNSLTSFFPASIENDEQIVLGKDEMSISFSANKILSWRNSQGNIIELIDLPNSTITTVDSNSINYNRGTIFTDRFEVLPAQIKNDVELLSLPSFTNSEYFAISEVFTLPNGWSIVAESSNTSDLIETNLLIINSENDVVYIIPAPLIYEKNNPPLDGTSAIDGKYMISNNGNNWELTTLVPSNWISAPERNFPIIIDPTVVLPGADGGWMSAVNLVNNPNYVFIGVCCGNQEHRAWLNFNTSSIDDASCVTNVELEVSVTAVGATATELVHAYDMTYLPGPYPGIDALVLNDMVTGWYTSFSLSGTGTYGYYTLGTWANSVLQSQLSVNWYQVALVFDNEPSTNWKRLTAGNCNLRVTYLDPPCSLLPIELTDFKVTCNESQTYVEWSTASEVDNDYFTVWRSKNNLQFEPVYQVNSKGKSQSKQTYSWTSDRIEDEVVYYRLSQTDLNGETTFFDTETLLPCKTDVLVSINEEGNLVVSGNDIVELRIIDIAGKTVFASSLKNNEQFIQLTNISSGVYTVSLLNKTGEKTTHSIIIP